MKIVLTSLFVDNQAKAHKFYTEVLGFVTKHDLPVGDDRWLTLVSPEAPEGVEMLLEPMGIPAAVEFQRALRDAGIPAKMFGVADVEAEYNRLMGLGVNFTMGPTPMGPVTIAVFDDTCGNLIQIVQG